MAHSSNNTFSSNTYTKNVLTNSTSIVNLKPTTIPGCVLWLDAADPLNTGTAPANGTSITTWYDKSGGNRNGTASGTITYNTTGLNSKPAMSLTGSQNFQGAVSITGTSLTVLMVCTMNAATGGNGRFISLAATGAADYNSTSYMCFVRNSSGTAYATTYRNSAYISTVTNPITTYTPYLFETWFDGTNIYTTTQNGNTTAISSVASSGNFGVTNFSIGSTFITDGTGYFYGFMSEVLVYNTALTTTQRQQLEGYLSRKWGLQSNLPSSHPYYNSLQRVSMNPAAIPGCVLWLDAADPLNTGTAPANGTSITTWYDKSGSTNNATIFTGTVTYNTTGVNSKPAMSFNNTQFMTGPIKSPITGNSLTILAIVSMNSTTTTNGRALSLSQPNGLDYGSVTSVAFARRNGTTGIIPYRSDVTLSNNPPSYSTPYLFECWFDGTNEYATTQMGSTTSIASIASTGNFNISAFAIGNECYTATGDYFNGFISEILVYNTALSTAQRQLVEDYLSWKWGLQANLPTTHPYYNSLIIDKTTYKPTSIPGCTLWLDAADPLNTGTAPANGTSISLWQDKSTNAFSFTQATSGNQPTYVTNALNGNPTIQFTAANSTYLGGPTNFATGTNSFAVFAVFKWTDATSTGWVFNKSLPGGVSGRILMGRNSSTITAGLTLYAADGLTTSFTDTYPANTYRILCFIYNRGSRTTTVYQNGTSIISQTYTASDVATSQTNSFNFIVGGYNNGTGGITPPSSGLYLNGSIAEILNFTNSYDMSTSVQQEIEGYLSWKWGLQSNLPSTHPYYTSINALSLTSLTPNVKLPYFSPRTINGCALWFDAADSSTIVQSSSKVSQWNDKSGNGYSVIQPVSANQPTYTTNLLNGKPGIVLSNTSWLYQLGSNIPNFSGSSAMTVFCVARNDTTMPSSGWSIVNTMWFTQANTTNGNTLRYHLAFSYGTTPGVSSPANTNNIVNQNTTNVIGYGANAIIGLSWSTTSGLIYVNGNTSTYAGETLVNANNSTVFNIGDARQQSYVKDIAIYEFVGFNTQLTTYQQQKIEGYLAWKWGLQSNLPTTHPYYSYPPTTNTPLYNPVSIPGCLLWLDAADKGSILGNSQITPNSTAATTASWTNNGITWTASASESANATCMYYSAFNFSTYVTGGDLNAVLGWQNASINGTTPWNYNGTGSTTYYINNTTTTTKSGGWLQIQSSTPVVLNSYTFTCPGGNGNGALIGRIPGKYTIVGSNNGTTWYNLVDVIFTGLPSGTTNTAGVQTTGSILLSTLGTITSSTTANTNTTTTTYGYQTGNYIYFRIIFTNTLSATVSALNNIYANGCCQFGWTPYFSCGDSAYISQWNDKSNSGYNMVQATINSQPLYGTMTNGKPGLNLATSRNMSSIAMSFPTNYSIFAVGYTTDAGTGGTNRLIHGNTNGDSTLFFGKFGNPTSSFGTFVGNGTSWNDTTANTTPTSSVATLCLMEMTNNNTSNGLLPYFNGTAQTAKNGTTVAFTGLTIGAEGIIASQYWNGYVAEILIFNSVLTTAKRQYIEGYLANKWNIQSSLPVAHPYYLLTPPTYNLFTPNSVNGCILWLDATDNTTITQASSVVSQWNDKSGTGNNMTQATSGSRPVLSNLSNGIQALNFASGKFMSNSSIVFPTNYSVFAVGYGNGTGYGRLLNGNTTTNDAYLFLGADNTGAYYASFVSTGSGWINDTNPNSPNYNVNSLCLMEMTNNNTSNGLIPYFNGNAQTPKNGTTASFTGLNLGLTYNGGSQYWNGYICEVIVFNSVLSTTNRQYVEGYLAYKWGIQSSLPTSHPYYSPAPVISTTAPTAPTDLTITNSTSTSVTVKFTAPYGQITTYKPYINGALATSYYGTPNSFTINGLTNGSYINLQATNLYGTSPAVTALITNNPASASLYARYTPNNYNPATNIWSDTMGTYNIPSSQITNTGLSLVTNSSNTYGAMNSLVALQGTPSSIIGFTTANITNYTLFYVARFTYPITNAVGRECLLTASGGEFWMSGFYSGATAAAHHNTSVISIVGHNPYDTDWFISTDSFSLYKANGINYGAAAPGGGTGGDTYLPPLWINGSMTYNAGGPSNFQIADLIIYNSYLSTTDISNVEIYLSNLYGIPLITSPTISSITSNTATLTFTAPADDNNNTTYTASTRGIVYGTTTGSNYTVLQTNTFSYTGANQTITVPTGTAFVTAQLWGAGGGGAGNGSTNQTSGVCLNDILGSGGGGGYTSANLVVTAGTTLTIIVGQAGTVSAAGITSAMSSTYGGGGGGGNLNGDTNWRNTSGGGRTAIQISAADIITAGGGGGGGHLARLSYTVPTTTYLTGGAGGGTTGGTGGQGDGAGQSWNGVGGTQTGGGAAGTATSGFTAATAGTQYQGGTGNAYAAGGGGGYYGGGGGQYYQPNVQYFGAGGGGSSYVSPTYLKTSSDYILTQASGSTVAANSFLPSSLQGLIGGGGAGSTSGGTGQNGYVILTFYQAATVSPTKTISLTGLSSLLTNNAYPITVTSTNAGFYKALPVASLLTLPGSPVIGTVTVSGTTATVPFTPISGNGTVTNYTVISNPAGFNVKGTSSPIVVYGLTQNTSYTFTMTATNATGTSSSSASSNSITTGSQIGAVYTTQTNGTVSTVGAITSTGTVKTISFTTSATVNSPATFVGTFTTTVALSNVNICVVSGGGGGGQNNGGGGGGGAVLIYETGRANAATIAAGTTIYIYVGAGGEGSKLNPGNPNVKWTQYALSGSNSYLSVVSGSITASGVNLGSTITATNLGYATNHLYNQTIYTTQWQNAAVQTNNASYGAGAGGGGGAGAIFNNVNNISYGGLGNGSGGNGGNAYGDAVHFSYNNGAGGGGGGVNGAAGGNYYASGNGGAGGAGTQFQATGVYYGGGGGGGVAANAAGGGVGGAGGNGGGGAGSKSAIPANGTANTGGGGGGAGNGSYSGGDGANGIVVISFTY